MKRLFKWLLPLLIVAEFILFRFDVIDLGSVILIAVLFEILIMAMVARQVVAAAKVFDHNRRSGQDAWTAFAAGLETFMPYPATRAMTIEIQMWYYLGKWLLRRNRHGENEFTYHKKAHFLALPPSCFLSPRPRCFYLRY
jgi:hypothetical protein